MAIKFEDIKDDETPAKKAKPVKTAAASEAAPDAKSIPPDAPESLVPGGLPFPEPDNAAPKPKRRGRPIGGR